MTGRASESDDLSTFVEWRPWLWARATRAALHMAEDVLLPSSRVLELGFHSGKMSCYLASHYDVSVVGYESDQAAVAMAQAEARRLNVSDQTEFHYCPSDQTLEISGTYDAVFVKSVLYHLDDAEEYVRWLVWIRSLLRPGGCLIAVENGRGDSLTRVYRRFVMRARWSAHQLISSTTLSMFTQVFDDVEARFFGRFSQFFEPLPRLRDGVRRMEERVLPPGPDSSFVAAINARVRLT